jgi:PleD family two-component response regulator
MESAVTAHLASMLLPAHNVFVNVLSPNGPRVNLVDKLKKFCMNVESHHMHKILLVEDSSDSYSLVKRALGASIHLEWAKSLAEAQKAVKKNAFDLILLDVMLPAI